MKKMKKILIIKMSIHKKISFKIKKMKKWKTSFNLPFNCINLIKKKKKCHNWFNCKRN